MRSRSAAYSGRACVSSASSRRRPTPVRRCRACDIHMPNATEVDLRVIGVRRDAAHGQERVVVEHAQETLTRFVQSGGGYEERVAPSRQELKTLRCALGGQRVDLRKIGSSQWTNQSMSQAASASRRGRNTVTADPSATNDERGVPCSVSANGVPYVSVSGPRACASCVSHTRQLGCST